MKLTRKQRKIVSKILRGIIKGIGGIGIFGVLFLIPCVVGDDTLPILTRLIALPTIGLVSFGCISIYRYFFAEEIYTYSDED